MSQRMHKPRLRTWIPFGLRRVDTYFSFAYLKIFVLIFAALAMLIAVADVFQNFDKFIIYSRTENLDLYQTASLIFHYYASFAPFLLFRYMFQLAMLLSAVITATSAYLGPRGNNEYTVLRSVGVSVRRAILPLVIPAFFISIVFQATRDYYLPGMVRTEHVINNLIKGESYSPIDISLVYGPDFHSASMGYFSSEAVAYNLILEVRDLERYQRGDALQGDNDFVSYQAREAALELRPDGEGYQWRPLRNAEMQTFTRFSRKASPWTTPVPTSLTPAMIERQTLGDAVCSWRELNAMRLDNSGARFELHWRLAEPIAACLLMVWGLGICMGRMLRGRGTSYIQSIAVSMLITGLFTSLRLAGKSLWETGTLAPPAAARLPIAVAVLISIPIVAWMER